MYLYNDVQFCGGFLEARASGSFQKHPLGVLYWNLKSETLEI